MLPLPLFLVVALDPVTGPITPQPPLRDDTVLLSRWAAVRSFAAEPVEPRLARRVDQITILEDIVIDLDELKKDFDRRYRCQDMCPLVGSVRLELAPPPQELALSQLLRPRFCWDPPVAEAEPIGSALSN
jgi:hypothetical protein